MLTDKLYAAGVISPPKFLASNTAYETIMGSEAYGVSKDTSDKDIYGFCIPPKDVIFPNSVGKIYGFDEVHKFEQYQQHHVKWNKKTYDLNIYNIVKFFRLCMDNNPNMVDSLYTPIQCVLHASFVGGMVREKRDIFLHKGCWVKFKGYAYSQLHKMKIKNPDKEGKRRELVEKHGFDVKFAYHVVRLLDECEQILTNGTLDLQRSRNYLKAIREGEVPEEEIYKYFDSKQTYLEKLYQNSKLPDKPRKKEIKQLLMDCLEHHYGSIEVVEQDERLKDILLEAQSLLGKAVYKLGEK